MDDLKVQQNLEENIKKVFEKIREEGNKGVDGGDNCYPVEEEIEAEIMRTLTKNIYETKIVIKDYNDFRKLIQTLDTLINMYSRLNIKDFEELNKIRIAIEEQIENIQNTGLVSLDKGFVSQYSCLIKCYDGLLRMSRQFVDIEQRNRRNNNLPQYNITLTTNIQEKDNVDDFVNQMTNYEVRQGQ